MIQSKEEKVFILWMLVAMFLWGAGWPALKVVTAEVSFEVVTFWRFLIMSFTMIPILIYIKKPLHVKKESIKHILSNSVLNVAFMVFAFLGVQAGTASAGGVIITTLSPLLTFILISFVFKHTLSKLQIVGLFIGLVGGFIMTNIAEYGVMYLLEAGNIYYILAALSWAIITLVAQSSHQHLNPIHFSYYIAIVATLLSFILAFEEDIFVVFNQGVDFWMSLLYLSIFGQSIATTIFYIASGKLGSAKASSYMFLVPLFALLTSYSLLGEKMYYHIVLGGFISLIAVYLINSKGVNTSK